jgi:hypothetical protein
MKRRRTGAKDHRRGDRICPSRVGYVLASPWRGIFEDPGIMVEPYVEPGSTVLEPGPGFLPSELARKVGPKGRVVAVDVQSRMIGLKHRLSKVGLSEPVGARLGTANSLSLDDLGEKVDFILAVAMVHEAPSLSWLFGQVGSMKPGGDFSFCRTPRPHRGRQVSGGVRSGDRSRL